MAPREGLGFHTEQGPLLTPLHVNAPLAPSGTYASIFAGGLWDLKGVLVP